MSAFAFLAAPALRALVGAGVTSVADLATMREDELLALHGIGPNALRKLKAEMARCGVAFAES